MAQDTRKVKTGKQQLSSGVQGDERLRFLTHTLLPLTIMLLVPNVVVCLISFVVSHSSSSAKALELGFTNLWIESWTGQTFLTLETWAFIGVYTAYSGLSLLLIPGSTYYGPPTSTGHRPAYRKSGFTYYVITMSIAAFILLVINVPCQTLYRRMPGFAVALVLFASMISLLLYVKGRTCPSPGEHGPTGSVVFDFYWGLELYPRIADRLDVKQWTNCRFGMMMWQLLVLVGWKAQVEATGWNWCVASTSMLQTVYIAKFFWWEDGYMQTIDITVDRAGFYLCWGCVCFMSITFPITNFYMVDNTPDDNPAAAAVTFAVGVAMIALNYWTDYQKQLVRSTQGKCTIWGSPPTIIRAKYYHSSGKPKSSLLLVSGFWSLSRHANYIFEILIGLCWALPSGASSIVPYLYVLFLVVLLLHRSYRDEKKCSQKYGKYWNEYCSIVKYRIVPGIF